MLILAFQIQLFLPLLNTYCLLQHCLRHAHENTNISLTIESLYIEVSFLHSGRMLNNASTWKNIIQQYTVIFFLLYMLQYAFYCLTLHFYCKFHYHARKLTYLFLVTGQTVYIQVSRHKKHGVQSRTTFSYICHLRNENGCIHKGSLPLLNG